ncbi:hypothetical protein DH2020_007809 [Rehmannia glutinosa]|uniref:Reverse transcriptase Ty1/copia-type domain-containing protein n=1 Tax=Rehmannia glutinosa TaxID=99300 RepID=A0ABR0U083_REHGL
MIPPPGYCSPSGNRVCKLTKSLYGLKQASRQWFQKLTSCLITYGFSQSKFDSSLFIKFSSNNILILCVCVDDIILAGNNIQEIEAIKAHLDAAFTIKDLGQLKYFLGIEIARNKQGITLCQRKYALDLLTESGYLGCKPCSTPMDPKSDLSTTSGDPLPDPSVYRRLVGRLLYLTITRPDLSYSIQTLSQFMSNPTSTHLTAAHRVLRYIKSTPGKGLFYSANSPLQLIGFCDADWARCKETRRSISGFAIFLGDSLISWKAKKQPTISRSSTETEYRVVASISCEVQWFVYLLHDMKIQHPQPATIYTDNTSAIPITQNPVLHSRTKHIDVRYHFIRDHVEKKDITLEYISTDKQLANIFTKPLCESRFEELKNELGLIELS